MKMQPLYELKERLENCTLMGVGLIDEDFRLKRAAEQFAPLAAASPILKKIDTLLQELLLPATADRCTVLMDVLALVNAVAYTQGTTQVLGEMTNCPHFSYVRCLEVPFSIQKPLLQALNGGTNKAQRIARLKSVFRGKTPFVWDFRLLPSVLASLEDSSKDFANLVEGLLEKLGKPIVPVLKQDFLSNSAKSGRRHICLVDSIAGAAENDWYLSLLDVTEKEMRSMAIRALRHDSCNAPLLLDLAATEKGTCKKAVYDALTFMDVEQLPQVAAFWEKVLQQNPALLQSSLNQSSHPSLFQLIARQMDHLLDALLARQDNLLASKEGHSLNIYLDMLRGKASPACLDIYLKIAANAQIFKLLQQRANDDLLSPWTPFRGTLNLPDTMPILLLHSIYINPCTALFGLSEELYTHYGGAYLSPAFLSALLTTGAQEVYRRFSALFTPKAEDAIQAQNACLLLDVLEHVYFDAKTHCHQTKMHISATLPLASGDFTLKFFEPLCVEWFALLTHKPFVYTQSRKSGENNHRVNYILDGILDKQNTSACQIFGTYLSHEVHADFRSYYLPMLSHCGWQDCKGFVVKYVSTESQPISFPTIFRYLFALQMSPADRASELAAVDAYIHRHKSATKAWPTRERMKQFIEQIAQGKIVQI